MGGPSGNLIRNARGIITVSLSPFEQKAFPGFFSSAVSRARVRTLSLLVAAGPGLGAGFLLYKWTSSTAAAHARKNPKDFENDA
eukprot:m.36079 g.36079  ORF g.36079 m.36079 type:complete len:84 (+) comp44458_c0_seq1:124-375(+)